MINKKLQTYIDEYAYLPSPYKNKTFTKIKELILIKYFCFEFQ